MAQELKLTTMLSSEVGSRKLNTLLGEFEKKHHVHIHVRTFDLSTAWTELLQSGMHENGPDCSEISTSSLMDMVGMNAIVPMPPAMQARLNSLNTYLRGCLESASIPEDPHLWAVPWFAGLRVIYYRQDLLQLVGVEPEQAFSSTAALVSALERLQSMGIKRPWAVNTHHSLSTVHNITSWIWGAGGQIFDQENQRIVFAEPPALAGAADYFGLAPFLGPNPGSLTNERVANLFFDGQTAMTLDGHWNWLARRYASHNVAGNVRIAQPPGIPFVSGSSLVVWKHSHNASLAWELAEYLSGPSSAVLFSAETNLMPTRWDLLRSSGLDSYPEYEMIAQGMDHGRTWPHMPLSGMIEKELQDAYALVWQEVLANRDVLTRELILDILQITLQPVQRRLQNSLDWRNRGD